MFERYRAEKPSKFLFFDEAYGLDGKKLGEIQDSLQGLRKEDPQATPDDLPGEQKIVMNASIAGDRKRCEPTRLSRPRWPSCMSC